MNSSLNTWSKITQTALSNSELTRDEIRWFMDEAMSGRSESQQISDFLSALEPSKITPTELNFFGQEMTSHATEIQKFPNAVDIVGTGGDQLNTVNISTMASMVVAAHGIPVVKHGNRASSSSTGSADVIEALGVNLNQPIDKVEASIETVGIGFLFAQVFHPSMKHIAPIRKKLAKPTVFNYLGPMTNPAQPNYSVIGVAHKQLVEIIAKAFQQRENAKTLVVRGENGLDEISICGDSQIIKVSNNEYTNTTITPDMFGLKSADISEIKGGFAAENAQVVLDLLNGKKGAVRDAVLLNAAAGIYVHDYFEEDLFTGLERSLQAAIHAIDSGAALQKLNDWKEFSSK